MSKNKARSKALHQTFSEIIPEMDKALNKQLLEVLMKYTERDNELIVILNEDGPNIIELKSLKPVSLLAEKLSAYSSYYHVDVVELVVKKIDFEGAYKLLKASPDVPLFKSLTELDKYLVEEFEKYGLNSFLDVDNLDYSLEKASELKNEQLINWVSDIICKREKLTLRKRFDVAVKAHYENVEKMYDTIRPLMKKLDFPEDLMTHTFSELSVFETKGWDHAIKSKIETLAKRETQYLDDAAKAENRRLVTEKLENSLAIAPTKPTRNWLHIAGIACLVVCTFMYVTNKFI
ncbi:TPA: hypothetical protein N7L20_003593 [Escherichia coli]|nr:hypothetical protein [Escherichia coli]